MANPKLGAALGVAYTNIPARDLIPVQVGGKNFLLPQNSNSALSAPSVVLNGEWTLTRFGRFPLGVGVALDGAASASYQSVALSPYAKIDMDFPHGQFQVGARVGGSVFATYFKDNFNPNLGIDAALVTKLRLSDKIKLQLLTGAHLGFGKSTQFFTAIGGEFQTGPVQNSTVENPGAGISALKDARKGLDNLIRRVNAELQGYEDSDTDNIEAILTASEDYVAWLRKRDITWKNVGELPPLNDVANQLNAAIQYAKVSIPSSANRDHEIQCLATDIENLNLPLSIAILKILVMNEYSAFYKLQIIAKSIKSEITKRNYEGALAILSDYEDKLKRLHTQIQLVSDQIPKDHKFFVKPYEDHVNCWYKGEMCAPGVDFSLTLRQLKLDLDKIKPTVHGNAPDKTAAPPKK